MKLELKRPIKKYLTLYLLMVLLGVVFALISYNLADGIYYYGLGFAIICGVFAINEVLHTKDKKLFFEENGFTVGEKSYSYKDIEEVKTNVYRSVIYIKIIVNGENVFSFDNSYENSGAFFDILTKNGISTNLFKR